MNIRIKEVQHGWGITVSRRICDSLNLTTNAGVLGIEAVDDSKVKLSTYDEAQFKHWRAVLDEANCTYDTFEPSAQ